MNFRSILKKLDNQKGITGIDVVIAITIIGITVVAIMGIYTNVVVGSKKVTRQSAATRLATTILENVDNMYYAEIEQELERLNFEINGDYKYRTLWNSNTNPRREWKDIYNADGSFKERVLFPVTLNYDIEIKDGTAFNTKLTPGYTVEIKANAIDYVEEENEYGDISFKIERLNLVTDFNVIVKYKVSNRTEEVNLKTVKKREMVGECNEPVLEDLLGTSVGTGEIIESTEQLIPIKWSSDSNGYITINKSDDWYSYSEFNKEWARVIYYNSDYDGTSDSHINVNTNVVDINNVKVYMWIPRFGISKDAEAECAFAYKASNTRILPFKIRFWYNSNSEYLNINGPALYDYDPFYKDYVTYSEGAPIKEEWNPTLTKEDVSVDTSFFPEGKTGRWVEITGGSLVDPDGTLAGIMSKIQGSKYGPVMTHVTGKNLY